MDESEPVALEMYVESIRTRKGDGSILLTLSFSKDQSRFAAAFMERQDQKVGVAFTDCVQKLGNEYGDYAKDLKISAFFRMPAVWQHIGSDEEYLAWLRKQRCAYTNELGGENDSIDAAHVRRVSDGSGVGLKPKYSAIPLKHSIHVLQHNSGESFLKDQEWFDKKRIEYVSEWAWETLKNKLGYDSWAAVPPILLCNWSSERGLFDYLPSRYKEF